MARKLKTYRTSIGFFDLAVAAPSMKAALAAWDVRANLFHQGFASETDDAAIIAATMAKPGVVLRRAVGSHGAFREEAALPQTLPFARPPAKAKAKRPKKAAPKVDEKATRKAALAFEREERRRESERRKEEAAEGRARAARDDAIARAQAALDKAEADHDRRTRAIDKRARSEEENWARERSGLEAALRRVRR